MDHSSKASIHESVSVIKMKSPDTIVYEQDCHVFIMTVYSVNAKMSDQLKTALLFLIRKLQ